jgi:hypothetical protein
MPVAGLPFPSIVAASTNDPYMTAERARLLAGAWGARFMNVGACGRINVRSGFGPWPAGERILNELISDYRKAELEYAAAIAGAELSTPRGHRAP